MNRALLLTMLASAWVFACSGPGKNSDDESGDMDRRTEIRLTQYKVQGKQLYKTHCANCHQENGEGLAKLYPPLAKSDYLMGDLKRAACIIKNGMNKEIVVNGTTFHQMMPANEALTPLEIAEILTYISNSWENEAGISATRDVTTWLRQCEN